MYNNKPFVYVVGEQWSQMHRQITEKYNAVFGGWHDSPKLFYTQALKIWQKNNKQMNMR